MRLIDADALKDWSEIVPLTGDGGIDINDFDEKLKSMPTVDAVPVRHGHWQITDAYPHNVHCSVCHKRFAQTQWAVWEDGSLPRNYCPNCRSYNGGESE